MGGASSAVIAVVRRPSKSHTPSVCSSGPRHIGNELSTRAKSFPAWATAFVFETPTVRSTLPSSRTKESPSSYTRVRT
jgi:hypothetical protein